MTTHSEAEPLGTFLNPSDPLLTPEEKNLIGQLSANIVMHADLIRARDAIRDVVAENAELSEPRHVILIGDSGCGKSTLLDLIRAAHPPKEECFQLGLRLQQTILSLSLPSSITARTMAIAMLRALGDQSSLNGTCQELTERLIRYIKQCNVKVVFLDEFQHLLALGRGSLQGANQRLLAARNWIKSVIVATHVTFVLMGMPDTLALIDDEPQLERRFTHLLHLSPFRAPSESERGMVQFADDLLAAAVLELSLFSDAELFESNEDNAIRFYAATQGVPSTIKDLVIRAALAAYRRGSKVITMADFASAFAELRQARLEVKAAQIRQEKRLSFAKAVEGRVVNPFCAKAEELRPIIYQMAA